MNRAWDTVRENINISAKESSGLCESKLYKPWFDEECLKLVDIKKRKACTNLYVNPYSAVCVCVCVRARAIYIQSS
jgi:hypothetical protein